MHRAFVLVSEEGRYPGFTEYHLQHRRAARQMTGLPFDLPAVGSPYPTSSWPAQCAALWMRRHHPERFEAFDLALYEAFFRGTRDISSREVLEELAGLELPDLAALRPEVAAEHRQAPASAIPCVVLDGQVLTGLVDYQEARRAAPPGAAGPGPGAAPPPRG